MKKATLLTVFFSIWAISALWNEPRLYLTKTLVHEQYVSVKYEINFPGFVELQLFNPLGERIWVKGVVNDKKGESEFRIARKPMEDGKRYTFIVRYKGKDHSGSFYNTL